MRDLLRLCVVVCWVLGAVSHGNSQSDLRLFPGSGTQDVRVSVRIYDFENVPPPILNRAEEEATAIFGKAGVAVAWFKCWPRSPERAAVCGLPFGPSDLMLRILNRRMTTGFDLRPLSLGFALPAPDIGGGVTAYVSYDHVREVAGNTDSPASHVLAVVAAHELGHLLISSEAHSTAGIMRAFWPRKDLLPRRSQDLLFTSAESEWMKANLLGRLSRRDRILIGTDLHEPEADRERRVVLFAAGGDLVEPQHPTAR